MKKIFKALAAVFAVALVGVMSSCVQNFSGQYPELVTWYAPHTGDDGEWVNPGDDGTQMSYNSSTGLYELELETGRKNVGISVCKDANYSGQLNYDESDDATKELSYITHKTDDGGNGKEQLIIKKPGTYIVAVNEKESTWSVTEK